MANEENLKPWAKGQSGNPGGASKARLTFRRLIEQAVTDKDFSRVVKVLLKAAKKGEPWAVREFFDLTVGKNFSIEINGSKPGLASIIDIVRRKNEARG